MEIAAQLALEESRLSIEAEDSFASLVKRQSRFLFRIAYAMTRNLQDAEDVVQECFLKIFRSKAWQRMDDEKAFLARSIWRASVDRVQSRRGALEELPKSVPLDPEQAAITSDRIALVHRLIDRLPEELRQPLALSSIDELNSKEIGAVMNLPEGTVRTRLMRARQILRSQLKEF